MSIAMGSPGRYLHWMPTRFRLWLWSAIAATVALSLFSCGPSGTSGGLGKLATDQVNDTLFFAPTSGTRASVASFLLYNSGPKILHVRSLVIVDDDEGAFSLSDPPSLPFSLAPGREHGVTLQLKLSPKGAIALRARLMIFSDDADNVDDNGLFFVSLRSSYLPIEYVWSCNGGTINFAAVEKGRSVVKECTINNRQSADLVITGATYKKEKGGQKVDFAWVSPSFPFTVKSGGKKVVVKIKYTPSDYPPREDQGIFILESTNPKERDESKPRLKVVGLTAVALVELVPKYPDCTDDAACRRFDTRLRCVKDEFTSSNLCRQPEGQDPILKFPYNFKKVSLRRTFSIRSIGDTPLLVDGVTFDGTTSQDFKLVTSGISFPLAINPNEAKEITVEYTPSDDQEDTGQAIVSSNAGNKPKAPVILEAASRGCNVEVQPDKVVFSAKQLNQQITIMNRGNESCIINKVYFKSGKSEPFSLVTPPEANQTLVPNGSLSFQVRLSPRNGSLAKDALVVESTDPLRPTIEIPLEGPSVIQPGCRLKVLPAPLRFGFVPIGRESRGVILLQNDGAGPCELTSLTLLGTLPANHTAFALVNPVKTPVQIPGLGGVRVEVSFTPVAGSAMYEGDLQIESSDPSEPSRVVKILGTTGIQCLELLPLAVDVGSTRIGCRTPKRAVEVFHLGARSCPASVTVSKINLVNSSRGEFRIDSVPTLPRTLTAGQSLRLELSYKAKDLGVDNGALEIHNSAPGQVLLSIPLVGEGIGSDEQTDVFKQPGMAKVDIALIIDDSSSMAEEQASLARNIQAFANWAVRQNVDYHIIVTTTDVTKSGTQAPGCARGSTKIITSRTPNPAAVLVQNANVGTTGSEREHGLEAAYRMLTPPASMGCNKGFYRKDAWLSLIFVSDGEDESPLTVQFYLAFLKSLKGPAQVHMVRASAVVGPLPSGCTNTGLGKAVAAPRYLHVAKELRGVQASICSDWAGALTNIGTIGFGLGTPFRLSRIADPLTLKVQVNGQVVKKDPQDGWQYDAINNLIYFAKSAIPAPGAVIQVEYKALCLP